MSASIPLAPAPAHVPCKCCETAASLFGLVDFNQNCEIYRSDPLPAAGIQVPYDRCLRCGLIFTVAFDRFTREDFHRHIYNEQYALIDPDYREFRPTHSAGFVAATFPLAKSLRVLDYGGGSGRTAELLRSEGFENVTVFDPFVESFQTPPPGLFDLITCFEVIEHSPQPRETVAQIASMLDPGGLILCSTLMQVPNITEIGVAWWYIAPRNGHVSIFTRPAIAAIAVPLGLTCASFDDNIHVLYRRLPGFASHLMVR